MWLLRNLLQQCRFASPVKWLRCSAGGARECSIRIVFTGGGEESASEQLAKKEVHDRLNQAPDNSSRAPSSRAPRDSASADAQADHEGDDGEPGAADQEREGEEEAQTSDPSTGLKDK